MNWNISNDNLFLHYSFQILFIFNYFHVSSIIQNTSFYLSFLIFLAPKILDLPIDFISISSHLKYLKFQDKKKNFCFKSIYIFSNDFHQTPNFRVLLQRQDEKSVSLKSSLRTTFLLHPAPPEELWKNLGIGMQGHEGIGGRKKNTTQGPCNAWNKSEGNRRNGDAKGERARRDRRVFWLSVGSRSGAMCSVSSCSNL